MGEIEIVAECNKCETQFDDEDDVMICFFCSQTFCEDCQEEHGKKIIFDEFDEISQYLVKTKKEIIQEERLRVKKLK